MLVLIASIVIGIAAAGLILAPYVTVQYSAAQPSIEKDSNLKVESMVSGQSSSPTSMAFLDNHHILVLEKDGNVRLVSNGQLQPQPVLQVSVNTKSERGLLGIAVMNNSKAVFLYYTDSQGGGELRNRVYRYEWNGQTLVLDRRVITTIASAVKPNCFFIRVL
jgi:glucose/arabinose dehydrogenase